MKSKTKKVVAFVLATAFVLFDKFGGSLVVKANTHIREKIISGLDIRQKQGSVLKARYMPYKNNDIKLRKVADSSSLGLDEDWVEGEWYVEAHNASHFHHDLSIIANGKVYRLARTPSAGNVKKGFLGLFPGPKEKSSWVIQPEHLVHEVPNPGVIDDGYGAGTSKVIAKGSCLVKMSENGNLEVIFDAFEGMYAFIENGKDGSSLIVRKFTQGPSLGGKHVMKPGDNERLFEYIDDDSYYFTAKYDGAAVEWVVESKGEDKWLRIYSWREDKKLSKNYGVQNQIDHTYRLRLCDKKLPSAFPVSQGRGELYIEGQRGLLKLSGLLNSLAYRARTTKYNADVRLVVHDITEFRGVAHASELPYDQKLALMVQLSQLDKRFRVPQIASSRAGKLKMWETLMHKDGYDGVIIWQKGQSTHPIKMKFKHEEPFFHQAFIKRVEPQLGQHGDKFAYPILENEEGIEFKCAGKGLTNEFKADLYQHPEKYIGRRVYYSAEHHFEESGLPFQPVIKEIL